MAKPATFDGYSDQHTADRRRSHNPAARSGPAESVSVFLMGGLTPRYLVAARPLKVSVDAGTLDVGVVIDLQILAGTSGYRPLEEDLQVVGFERLMNERGQRLS